MNLMREWRKKSLQKRNRKMHLMFVFFLACTILVTDQEEKCFPVWAIFFLLDHSCVSISFPFDQFSLTLCDPMDCSTPGLPVYHQLPEITQTHVHWVGDAIQASRSLLSPSPPAFNLSQHQGLFQWVGSLHQVTKVLEFQLQHQSFQWILGQISFRMDWFDHLAIQGTLMSLIQYHSSKVVVWII